jgi:monofunctional glycosyltransferase
MFKKLFFILFLLFVGAVTYEYSSLPLNKIKTLKNGYPLIIRGVNKKLKIVKNKPRNWRKLSNISKEAYSAIVISEDWAFYDHKGYDPNQLEQAITQAIGGKRIRGASTITQQVVKNLFFSNEKSYIRKIKEIYLAKVLDKELSKQKILEIYLNIIEYGKNLYGISNASHFYFSKDTKYLNGAEGAFLAMLLPSPIRYSVSYREKKMTDYAQKTVNNILDKLVVAKIIDEARYEELASFQFNFIQEEDNTEE